MKDFPKFLKKSPAVLVIPTNEELMIAKQTYKIIDSNGSGVK
jgi:acetate kinase